MHDPITHQGWNIEINITTKLIIKYYMKKRKNWYISLNFLIAKKQNYKNSSKLYQNYITKL